MKKGEVYWVRVDPTVGTEIQKTRPCVVQSIDPINKARGSVVVVPLTSRGPERLPLVVELGSAKSYAVCDQIRAVAKQRFAKTQGQLSHDDMMKLDTNLKVVLGL